MRTAPDRSRPADLLLRNATIRSGSPQQMTERRRGAIAVLDGHITAVGTAAARLPARRTIDLDGALVLPGFVDTHTHISWAGAALWRVNWSNVSSTQDAMNRLAAAASRIEPGFWLLGGGWDRSQLVDDALPGQAQLDTTVPDKPCFLVSEDHSLAVCNSRAAELMMLDRLRAPSGGSIDRDPAGRPTGILRDAAARAMTTSGIIPPFDRYRRRAEVGAALRVLAGFGVTEIHDIATWPYSGPTPEMFLERSFTDVTLYTDLQRDGELRMRVGVRPFLGRWEEFATQPSSQDLVTFLGLKLFVGGFGYTPGGVQESARAGPGVLARPSFRYPGRAQASEWVSAAHRHGIACSLHAVGDRDVSEALDVFADALAGHTGRAPRHRLVHGQAILPADIDRIAELGLIVEAQPWDVASEATKLSQALDPTGFARVAPYRSLLRAEVPLAFGSDWRSVQHGDLREANPLAAVAAAAGRSGLDPREAITMTEALYCATSAGAFAADAEHRRGQIAVGYEADVVVLSEDVVTVDPSELSQVRALLTVVGGQIAHLDAALADEDELAIESLP